MIPLIYIRDLAHNQIRDSLCKIKRSLSHDFADLEFVDKIQSFEFATPHSFRDDEINCLAKFNVKEATFNSCF